MKMTRKDLKNLVKECLVEILAEGLSETQSTLNESRQTRASALSGTSSSSGVNPVHSPRKTIADKISFLPERSEIRHGSSSSASGPSSAALASSLTADPIMADIFADTARSGAHRSMNESAAGRVDHEQMIAGAGDAAAKTMLRSDPTDVFSDSAGKWAALAFAEKIPSRS